MKTRLFISVIFGITRLGYSQCGIGNALPSSGNIGLGTGAPANKLHIATCAQNGGIVIDQIGTGPTVGAAAISLKNSSNAQGRHWMIASTGNGNNGNGGNFEIDDFGTGPYNPTTSAINRFFIEGTTGHIGIGTIAPSEQLHTTSGVRFQGLTTGGSPANMVVSDATGKLWLKQISDIGNYCGQSTNNLVGNYEIPLNNFNFYFSGNSVNQQQKVNVGVPCSTSFPGKFNVTSGLATDVNGDSYGIYATNTNGSTANSKTGIYGATINGAGPGAGISRGLHGYSSSTSWMAFGVFGQAGPALRGWGGRFESINTGNDTNFGTQGLASGAITNYGGYFDASYTNNLFNYGLYASAAGGQTNWAGYFVGNVNIIGGLYINNVLVSSDRKLKKEIQLMTNMTEKIKLLKPSSYNFRTDEFKNMNLPEGKQLGLIAQEVEEIFPELVSQKKEEQLIDKDGIVKGIIPEHKAINYIGLIPVLISGIQEQQKQIEELKTLLNVAIENKSVDSGNSSISVNLNSNTAILLDQNSPNPFSENTIIKYNIPSDFTKAQIIFTTNSGMVIKTIDIIEKGSGMLNVFASDLSSGLYSYFLIIDGKTVDTKKMIKE